MAEFTGSLARYPARASFVWYFALIAVGALMLMRPVCHVPDKPPISALDALFTATSATCVTGLSVRFTGSEFSFVGQVVILALIQLGGIGIMTVTTYLTFTLGGRESLRHRAVAMETFGTDAARDLRWLLGRVLLMTFLIEGIGFVILAVRNLFDHPPATALWHALFHSVSAFCNAGFAIPDDSLVRYQGDPLVNFTIMGLIVSGGIGFPVMIDLHRNWRLPWRKLWDALHVHSKMMLIGTGGLIGFGTAMFLVLEWKNSLSSLPLGSKLLVALFQSITPRTAGFNTVEIGALTNATLFIIMLLMLVGAGPCSTGGGFKVSTLMVLVIRAWTTFRGFRRVNLFRRTIPAEVMARATATALVFAVVTIGVLTSLLVIEQAQLPHAKSQGIFLETAFEVISALGTVGLSTGITPKLSDFGRLVIILAMFIGRLGPISAFLALSRADRTVNLEFPQEEPLIG